MYSALRMLTLYLYLHSIYDNENFEILCAPNLKLFKSLYCLIQELKSSLIYFNFFFISWRYIWNFARSLSKNFANKQQKRRKRYKYV